MSEAVQPDTVDATRIRKRARLRAALGGAQMFGAAVSAVLLLHSGVTSVALLAVVLTTVCTTVSVLLFGSRSATRRD